MKFVFLLTFSKIIQISNFSKILSLGAELFHTDILMDKQADGRIEITNLIFALAMFRKGPKQNVKTRNK